MPASNAKRQELIVTTLIEAFEPLMKADPDGFRTKFRKMAADPFAFYRGSACLFYADMAQRSRGRDQRADDRTSRVWIHGDLHAENFGTYMNSEGVLVFDVNDFDEAYLGHFSWDLRRFLASLALMGWQKALPEEDIRRLSRTYLDAYVDQVRHYVKVEEDEAFALRLDNTDGAVQQVLVTARMCTRVEMLDDMTEVVDHERRFVRGAGVRELSKTERGKVERAFKRYLRTLSDSKRQQQAVFYDIKDVVGQVRLRHRLGRPAGVQHPDRGLQPGPRERRRAVDEAGQHPRRQPHRRPRARRRRSSRTRGTAPSSASASCRCTPTRSSAGPPSTRSGTSSPRCRRTRPTSTGARSPSPRRSSPSWSCSGRATAKIHCVSDEDSDEDLVDFQTEEAIIEAIDEDPDGVRRRAGRLRRSTTPRRPARTTPCSSTPSARARSTWSRPSASRPGTTAGPRGRGCRR